MYAVVHVWRGLVNEVRVTDDQELVEQWRAELEQEHGVQRDEHGNPESLDDEIVVVDVSRYQISHAGVFPIPEGGPPGKAKFDLAREAGYKLWPY